MNQFAANSLIGNINGFCHVSGHLPSLSQVEKSREDSRHFSTEASHLGYFCPGEKLGKKPISALPGRKYFPPADTAGAAEMCQPCGTYLYVDFFSNLIHRWWMVFLVPIDHFLICFALCSGNLIMKILEDFHMGLNRLSDLLFWNSILKTKHSNQV